MRGGGDESARLSGADAYNHCFAPPLQLSLDNEYSDDVSRARLYYNDFAELTRACFQTYWALSPKQEKGVWNSLRPLSLLIGQTPSMISVWLTSLLIRKSPLFSSTLRKRWMPGPPRCASDLANGRLPSVWSSL